MILRFGQSLIHKIMLAGKAGEIISKFIERRWPSDKKEVYEILRLGINKAWSEGKWLGMTKEFYVNVLQDGFGQNYFIAPQSHNVLLAINILGKPTPIRDNYFMFHRNGNGDVKDSAGCQWNQDIYDLGVLPYVDKNNIISSGIKVGIRSIGHAGQDEKVYINGKYESGNSIYTYKKSDLGNCCGCSVKEDSIDVINGIELSVKSNEFVYVNNITLTDITSISKTITRSPIEVIAIDEFNNGHLLARIDPHVTIPKYRKYLVPNSLCGRACLHAIFKIGQQETIISDTDWLMISNEEALISLAKSIHNIYYKENHELGASYFLQAITALAKEKKEEEANTEFPIQVEPIYGDDLGELKYYY